MKHLFKGRKPSPAMVVAIAALSVSLVGTAIAAPVAVISLSKNEKKQIRKIADKRITSRAPGLSVASANLAALASAVGDNTVGSAQLKDAGITPGDLANAAVTLDKLADNSVNSAKVIDESLAANDLGANSVGSSEIAADAAGGSEIATGAVGGDELENFHTHTGTTVEINDATALDGDWVAGTATASCTAGEQLVGFSAEWTSGGDEIAIQEIIPNFGTNSVTARGISDDGGTKTFRAVAVCVFN